MPDTCPMRLTGCTALDAANKRIKELEAQAAKESKAWAASFSEFQDLRAWKKNLMLAIQGDHKP
jgi:hypothetical protein